MEREAQTAAWLAPALPQAEGQVPLSMSIEPSPPETGERG
ncbi:rCG47103 [Rattus norvegicus]|uniref:RCG47103 n=1 Tax=Rattus norvegicus TaxID=10116 RepID=A6KQC0_RAT|nr:rCG47103 [Rattus norvegicus]